MIRGIVVFSMLCSILPTSLTFANRSKDLPARDPASMFRDALHMWESGDLSQFDEIVADDYVGHVASGTRDRQKLRQRIEAFHKLYPDIHFDVEDQFRHGNKLVTRMRAVGTNSSTGVKTELMGINISRVVRGKLAEEWATWEPVTSRG
jgi:ketosteroid isomerase-like protein